MKIQVEIRNEQGVALLQVVFVGALIALMAYVSIQMMTFADRDNLRVVRRNENLTNSILLSDKVSDKSLVKGLSTVPQQIGGVAVQYH